MRARCVGVDHEELPVRIQALEKILESETLGDAERAAAESVLAHKIAIYAAGAKKRGKLAEARAYEQRLEP